ncbi:hypothetical protein [Ralstonia pickettii]|uniref:hypothetical protein n=1 Tax=Ralstonia pickettii TaxID=329 RepID=UPI0015F7EF29|nr:hypothetical protein [Ralstonia pickettii]MBB0025860.1 hypothetical protein [Ralstonia pickettii]MBB0036781.1 hypothetical protein [Ralstonia pickettii]MBB0099188.1 hypothetical protein [Ralstonia pickettii]MBB0109116.1 hypothetical protein [Ralstonia pickettii]MBB0130095.1 hypothetical protein [Ralstonia pickettii]
MAEVQRRGYGWRSIFLINLPIGAAVIASLSLIPEIEANPGEKVDKLGTLVFGTAIILVVLPLIEGQVFGWLRWAFTAIAAGVALGLGFFMALRATKDRAGQSQLLPAALLRNRDYMAGLLHVAVLFSVIIGLVMVLGIARTASLGLVSGS